MWQKNRSPRINLDEDEGSLSLCAGARLWALCLCACRHYSSLPSVYLIELVLEEVAPRCVTGAVTRRHTSQKQLSLVPRTVGPFSSDSNESARSTLSSWPTLC